MIIISIFIIIFIFIGFPLSSLFHCNIPHISRSPFILFPFSPCCFPFFFCCPTSHCCSTTSLLHTLPHFSLDHTLHSSFLFIHSFIQSLTHPLCFVLCTFTMLIIFGLFSLCVLLLFCCFPSFPHLFLPCASPSRNFHAYTSGFLFSLVCTHIFTIFIL